MRGAECLSALITKTSKLKNLMQYLNTIFFLTKHLLIN